MVADRRVRVTFVLPSLLIGGIERHLIKMLARFDRSRFSLAVITLFDYPERQNLYTEVPSDVRVARLAFRGFWDASSWVRLYRALHEFSPDVVVSSMFSANAAVRTLKPVLGYRVVTREHNLYDDKKWYHCLLDHGFSYLSDGVVAVSRMVADYASAQARIPRRKFTVIHNGVDLDRVREFAAGAAPEVARVRAELGIGADRKIILNVARLKPQKNHDLLIDGFERFSKGHPEYILVVVGDGIERPRLDALIAQRGLGDRVRMLGFRKDVYSWFAAADVFALTSRREGFPNVGVEALAFGLPFISTLVSGVDEIIEDGRNGYITAADPDALAAAFGRVAALSPADRAKLSEACQDTARRFDMPRIVRKYEDFILQCCHRTDLAPSPVPVP
jgi:glycosyltransferase involved in cell wall biosynthesis